MWLPALGCLLLAIMLLDAGSNGTELSCRRADGTCTWRAESLFSRRERTFRIADVREVRFVEGLGKHKRDAETTLVFASGREMRLARGKRDAAQYRFAGMRGFFAAGSSDPWLAEREDGTRWLWLVALGLAIAAGVLGVRTWRAPRPALEVAQPHIGPTWWQRRRRTVVLALGAIAIVGAGQLALLVIADRTQGTLSLDCQGRCRFQGAECLPGGEVRMTLDPGAYTIDVWTGAEGAPWSPRTFAIAVGETTDFICAP